MKIKFKKISAIVIIICMQSSFRADTSNFYMKLHKNNARRVDMLWINAGSAKSHSWNMLCGCHSSEVGTFCRAHHSEKLINCRHKLLLFLRKIELACKKPSLRIHTAGYESENVRVTEISIAIFIISTLYYLMPHLLILLHFITSARTWETCTFGRWRPRKIMFIEYVAYIAMFYTDKTWRFCSWKHEDPEHWQIEGGGQSSHGPHRGFKEGPGVN